MNEDYPREGQFGPRVNDSVQWARGANRLVDMACKASDELEWWHEDDGRVTVRNTKYDIERTEDMLWRALWILERDIRVENGWPGESVQLESESRESGGSWWRRLFR